jgi:hypothetical protein
VAYVIAWINGSFGAGKTSLAEELRGRFPGALLYDPEEVGFMLRDAVPPTEDFQDLAAWRILVAEAGRVLVQQYPGRLVIAPMTVVDPRYTQEIFGGLAAHGVAVAHFFLKVSADTLAERIGAQVMFPDDPERDAVVRAWRLAQIERCQAALDALPSDTVILDGEASTTVLAQEVVEVLGRDSRFAAACSGSFDR